jgi:hypothetical protein
VGAVGIIREIGDVPDFQFSLVAGIEMLYMVAKFLKV